MTLRDLGKQTTYARDMRILDMLTHPDPRKRRSIKQVAAIEHLAEGSVRWMLSRRKKELRKKLRSMRTVGNNRKSST